MQDIHLERQDLAAHGLDFPREFSASIHIAQAERNIRASMSQRQENGAAQSASRASDQSDLTGQIKSREFVHEEAGRAGAPVLPESYQ
jgi:hypothetical protein